MDSALRKRDLASCISPDTVSAALHVCKAYGSASAAAVATPWQSHSWVGLGRGDPFLDPGHSLLIRCRGGLPEPIKVKNGMKAAMQMPRTRNMAT
jgi:hypothetical protein